MSDSRDAETLPASASGDRARPRPRLIALTIAFHSDPVRVGERALVLEQESGAAVELARHALDFAHPGSTETPRPLADPHLSREPVMLRVDRGALRLDAAERVELVVSGRPVHGEARLSAAELEVGGVVELAGYVVLVAHYVELGPRPERHGLSGESVAIDAARRAIERVADLSVPVLVRGQTGVGKERVARAIHAASGRAPFVAVNVATLPASLASAELFGHTKGAFTGAGDARAGLFERADGGTLFLDEVAELSDEVQAMLLRVLDHGEVRRLGEERDRPLDIRVLAATDADLEADVAAGRFREALYHRLRGFEIAVPPLCERREDIGRLAVELLREELRATGELVRLSGEAPWLERELLVRLLRHPWPGNVRELRGVLRQIVVASRGEPRLFADAAVERALVEPRAPASEVGPDALLAALERHGWSFTRAARDLGLSKAAFYRLAESHPEVRTAADLERAELEQALAAHGDVVAAASALRVSARALKLRLAALKISSPR